MKKGSTSSNTSTDNPLTMSLPPPRQFAAPLPEETLLNIFSFLDPQSILNMSLVEKSLSDFAKDHWLWKKYVPYFHYALAEYSNQSIDGKIILDTIKKLKETDILIYREQNYSCSKEIIEKAQDSFIFTERLLAKFPLNLFLAAVIGDIETLEAHAKMVQDTNNEDGEHIIDSLFALAAAHGNFDITAAFYSKEPDRITKIHIWAFIICAGFGNLEVMKLLWQDKKFQTVSKYDAGTLSALSRAFLNAANNNQFEILKWLWLIDKTGVLSQNTLGYSLIHESLNRAVIHGYQSIFLWLSEILKGKKLPLYKGYAGFEEEDELYDAWKYSHTQVISLLVQRGDFKGFKWYFDLIRPLIPQGLWEEAGKIVTAEGTNFMFEHMLNSFLDDKELDNSAFSSNIQLSFFAAAKKLCFLRMEQFFSLLNNDEKISTASCAFLRLAQHPGTTNSLQWLTYYYQMSAAEIIKAFLYAANSSDLECVQWLNQYYLSSSSQPIPFKHIEQAFINAAQGGNLACLQWLNQEFSFSHATALTAFSKALEFGKIKEAEWLMQYYKLGIDFEKALSITLKSLHPESLAWMANHYPIRKGLWAKMLKKAVDDKNTDALRYISKHYPQFPDGYAYNILRKAIKFFLQKDKEVLHCIQENYEISSNVIEQLFTMYALKYHNLDAVKCLASLYGGHISLECKRSISHKVSLLEKLEKNYKISQLDKWLQREIKNADPSQPHQGFLPLYSAKSLPHRKSVKATTFNKPAVPPSTKRRRI